MDMKDKMRLSFEFWIQKGNKIQSKNEKWKTVIKWSNTINKNKSGALDLLKKTNKLGECRSLKDWSKPWIQETYLTLLTTKNILKPKDKKTTNYSPIIQDRQGWRRNNRLIKSETENNKVSERTKVKTSAYITWSQRISNNNLELDMNTDEGNKWWNEIDFKTLKHKFGIDIVTTKIYHYSDIINRYSQTKSKLKLDSMPELLLLKDLTEPISYNKIWKKKVNDNISYSEEIAGSVKTVYSSSDNDRIEDFMNEEEMIAKVSEFLSVASIHSGTNKDMLASSFHEHTYSFSLFNNETLNLSVDKKNLNSFNLNQNKGLSKLRPQSTQKRLFLTFNYGCM